MTKPSAPTVEQLIRELAARFDAAGLSYGHGTDNALDEAAWLVFAKLGLSHADVPGVYSREIGEDELAELLELAERTGESMQAVLAKAIEDYRRKTFLESANTAFAALRSDPQAWQHEQEERAAWEVTVGDGQEPEP